MPIAIYHPKLHHVRTIIRDDHGGYRPPDGWKLVPVEKLPDGWIFEPPTQEQIECQIVAIKLAAREDILSKFPEWRQANMTARAVELLDFQASGAKWSAEERAEADAIRQAWAWIKERRVQSDAEEKAITQQAP